MQKILSKVTVSLLATGLAACSILPEWVGADQSSTKLQGERIPVFKLEEKLHPDTKLGQLSVTLPPVGEEGHPALAGDLSSRTEISIGEAGKGDYTLKAAPLIVGDVLYTMDAAGNVMAYDAASPRRQLWKVRVLPHKKGRLFAGGGIAYTDSVLFITNGAEEVIALDSSNGKELWRSPVGNVVRSAPLAAGGMVFAITLDNQLYAMRAEDGQLLWTHNGAVESIGLLGAASPVMAAGLVIAPYSSGELYALDPATGQEIWSGNLAYSRLSHGFSLNDIDVAPVVGGDILYAAGNAGVFYAVKAPSGQRLWHQDINMVRGIWAAGEFLYILDGNGQVSCIVAKDGSIKWVSSLPQDEKSAEKQEKKPVASGPVLAGETLLVTSSNGTLFILSPYDGKILNKISIPEAVTLPPVVALGNVYILSNKAKLVMLR